MAAVSRLLASASSVSTSASRSARRSWALNTRRKPIVASVSVTDMANESTTSSAICASVGSCSASELRK